MESAWSYMIDPARMFRVTDDRLSPCGHIFCAECLVSWFSVAEEVAHTSRNARRKKVCPSCRAQVVTPPLELWALKGVLQAVREHYGHTLETPEIQTSLWDGVCHLTYARLV